MQQDYFKPEFSPKKVLDIYEKNPQKNEIDSKIRFRRPAYDIRGYRDEQKVNKQFEDYSSE